MGDELSLGREALLGRVRRGFERVLRGGCSLVVHLHNDRAVRTVASAISVPRSVSRSRVVDRHRPRWGGGLRSGWTDPRVMVVMVDGTPASAMAGGSA